MGDSAEKAKKISIRIAQPSMKLSTLSRKYMEQLKSIGGLLSMPSKITCQIFNLKTNNLCTQNWWDEKPVIKKRKKLNIASWLQLMGTRIRSIFFASKYIKTFFSLLGNFNAWNGSNFIFFIEAHTSSLLDLAIQIIYFFFKGIKVNILFYKC